MPTTTVFSVVFAFLAVTAPTLPPLRVSVTLSCRANEHALAPLQVTVTAAVLPLTLTLPSCAALIENVTAVPASPDDGPVNDAVGGPLS